MSERDTTAPFTQEALDRLTADRSDEVRDRAHRLGKLVRRNLDLAIANPENVRYLGMHKDGTSATATKASRVGNHQSAFLEFGIPPQFQNLEGTSEWLSHTERVLLRMNIYDVDLPEGIDMENTDFGIPDTIAELAFDLTPAPEYGQEPGVDPRVAAYEDGSRVDHQDTETIIGVLTLLAEQAE